MATEPTHGKIPRRWRQGNPFFVRCATPWKALLVFDRIDPLVRLSGSDLSPAQKARHVSASSAPDKAERTGARIDAPRWALWVRFALKSNRRAHFVVRKHESVLGAWPTLSGRIRSRAS